MNIYKISGLKKLCSFLEECSFWALLLDGPKFQVWVRPFSSIIQFRLPSFNISVRKQNKTPGFQVKKHQETEFRSQWKHPLLSLHGQSHFEVCSLFQWNACEQAWMQGPDGKECLCPYANVALSSEIRIWRTSLPAWALSFSSKQKYDQLANNMLFLSETALYRAHNKIDLRCLRGQCASNMGGGLVNSQILAANLKILTWSVATISW